jgi:hypothetical protein
LESTFDELIQNACRIYNSQHHPSVFVYGIWNNFFSLDVPKLTYAIRRRLEKMLVGVTHKYAPTQVGDFACVESHQIKENYPELREYLFSLNIWRTPKPYSSWSNLHPANSLSVTREAIEKFIQKKSDD